MNDEAVSFNYVLKQNKSLKDFRESLIKEKENKNTSKNRLVEIEKQLKTIKTKIKEKEHEYVKNAKLIATTISKVSIDPLFDERKFDVVMFDEVSMAYVPQVIFAASLAKEHFICVGDFKQLAPIAQSEAKKYLCRDIFYHLGINENDGQPHYHPWLVMLNEQRRMYPDISNFSNRYIYKGLLKDYYNVAHLRKHIVAKGPFNNKSMNIIDLTGTQCIAGKNNDNSRFNILSAIIAFGTALEALKNKQKRVGIITPYSAQSRLIHAMTIDYGKELSTKLACSTVHQFQGSEREVIIFDSVESYPSNKPGWLMSKNENDSLVRLINVAVTRAKGKLITIANSNFWTKKFQNSNNTYYLLVKHIMNYHNVIDNKNHILGQYLANIDYGKNIKSFNDINKAIEQLLNDLSNTEQQIIVSIPDGHLNDEYQDVIINKLFWLKKKGIDILMKSNDYISLPRKWKELSFSDELNGFPLILIDNKLIWYGLPISRGALKDGDSYYHTTLQTIYRIKGMHTVELIKSLTEIENRFNDGVKKKLYSREKDNEVQIDNVTHKQFDGIGLYIRKNEFCLNCKSPMVLAKGRSGKPYIKCSKCKETSILSVDTVNQYILEKNIKCPQHNCHIYAKVGPYGLYVKCDKDHTVKVEEI